MTDTGSPASRLPAHTALTPRPSRRGAAEAAACGCGHPRDQVRRSQGQRGRDPGIVEHRRGGGGDVPLRLALPHPRVAGHRRVRRLDAEMFAVSPPPLACVVGYPCVSLTRWVLPMVQTPQNIANGVQLMKL